MERARRLRLLQVDWILEKDGMAFRSETRGCIGPLFIFFFQYMEDEKLVSVTHQIVDFLTKEN